MNNKVVIMPRVSKTLSVISFPKELGLLKTVFSFNFLLTKSIYFFNVHIVVIEYFLKISTIVLWTWLNGSIG